MGDKRRSAIKLEKLVYYTDIAHYIREGDPVTGATYLHYPDGPASHEFWDTIYALAGENKVKIYNEYYVHNSVIRVDFVGFDYESLVSLDLSKNCRNLCREVVSEFWTCNQKQICDISKEEFGFKGTENYEEIPYNNAYVSKGPLTMLDYERGKEIAARYDLLNEASVRN